MDHYNNSRTHQGKHGQRRTLIQTFTESFDLVKQKNLDIKNAQVFDTYQL